MFDEFASTGAIKTYEQQLAVLVGKRLHLSRQDLIEPRRVIKSRFPVIYDKLITYQTAHAQWARGMRSERILGKSQDRLWRRREATRKMLVTAVEKQAKKLSP